LRLIIRLNCQCRFLKTSTKTTTSARLVHQLPAKMVLKFFNTTNDTKMTMILYTHIFSRVTFSVVLLLYHVYKEC